jgi:hypothetical protein
MKKLQPIVFSYDAQDRLLTSGSAVLPQYLKESSFHTPRTMFRPTDEINYWNKQ